MYNICTRDGSGRIGNKRGRYLMVSSLMCLLLFLSLAHPMVAQPTIQLVWTPNSEPDLSHYFLYRDTIPGTMVYLDSISGIDSSYTDSMVVPGTIYYYKLTALNFAGLESEPSNEVTNANHAPQLTPIQDQSMNEGDTLNVPVSSSDPDGDNITLSANNLPSFGSLIDNGDGTGKITFTPGFGDVGLYPNIEVIATDSGYMALSDTIAFTLSVTDSNRAPQLVSLSDHTMNEGDTLDILVSSSDPDGDNITLTANNLPPFGELSDNGDGTGTIHFTPTFNDSGAYPAICIIATDDGTPALSDTSCFALTVEDSIVVAIEDLNNPIPTTFGVSANYPNPFNPATTIKFQIPAAADVTLEVYNMLGQKVRTLVNSRLSPGYYETNWSGINDEGEFISSGVYIYRIEAADFVRSRKMILMK